MESLQTILFVLQVLVAISLIGLILIQHGKGADAGAAFGSGASSTVFGARGSGNFLTRTTTILAFVFLANSLGLGYIATQQVRQQPESLMIEQDSGSVMRQQFEAPVTEAETPAVPDTTEAPVDYESDVPAVPEE
jgi:preprotein translocase subunit SecG